MEIRHFEAFLTVAEELHFGRAAERLVLAQPALSRLIRAMEKEIGAELFERTTRKVRLTAAGQSLLEPARMIAYQVQGVKRIARSASGGQIGLLRVGYAGTTGYSIVARLAREVSLRQPGITLQLQPRNFAGEAMGLVRDGELDLAVLSPPVPDGLGVHLVSRENLVLAVPEGHRLACRKAVHVRELARERFICFPATQGSRVRDSMITLCAQNGFVPDIIQEAPDAFSLLALVGAGVGASLVVESSLTVPMDGVRYIRLHDTQVPLPIALGWRDTNRSVTLRTVVDLAREIFPEP